MKDVYLTEREGQVDFYKSYLPLVDNSLDLEDILADNNDGVLKGNILEFKTMINDPNAVLFQAIKYLSARRIKGKPVPKNILLISLNDKKAYLYDSQEYLNDIEKVYSGSASKNNIAFSGGSPISVMDFYTNQMDEAKLIQVLKENNFIRINIDDNCIVGWASKYYRENPDARKADFIGDLTGKVKIVGEIRKPDKFKNYIKPYEGETNIKFNYLMDKLNDDIQKKNLGAFYTPDLYAEKSLELVRKAIKKVPEGNDYVIIDRCAGTGNLERGLTDEELSHCILSTYEYYEYKVLIELLGDKVRHIIPPTEKEDTFDMGLVRGADALSKDYIENKVIKQYVDDANVTIILFENPPYAEVNGTTRKNNQRAPWKKSYAAQEMKKEVKGTASNELGNVFIWSGFKYYLRQPTDSYVVYSPIKYWKSQSLVNKKFIDGFAFNRKHFHAPTPACIICALWVNENEERESFKVKAYDIEEDTLVYEDEIEVKKIHSLISSYYDKRTFEEDTLDGIAVELNGLESHKAEKKIRVKKINNDNIIGYLVANGSGFDNPRLNSALTVAGRYDSNGFFLRKDNYLEKLPLFASGKFTDNYNDWKVMSLIMKSSDKAEEYERDTKNGKLDQWLLKVLLWASLTNQSHMRSFIGSNGRLYRNELSLDTTNGETIASKDLGKLIKGNKEKELLSQWNKVLESAKNTKNYNKDLTYGIYQIDEELNTRYRDKKTKTTIYDYPELNGHIKTLKALLKEYYLTEIMPTLFEYEFLK